MAYETTLQMARVAEDRQGEWQALMDLGFLWAARDYAQTGALYQQSLALAREIGSWNWIRIVSGFLARLLLLQGDLTRAESLLNSALAHDAPSQTIGQRIVWDARAALALAGNNPALALDIVDRLIATAANLSGEQVIPHLWKARGDALAALGRRAEAEAALLAAQVTAQEHCLKPLLWRIALAQGNLYHAQAQKRESERAFATARTLIEELAARLVLLQLQRALLHDDLTGRAWGRAGHRRTARTENARIVRGSGIQPSAACAGGESFQRALRNHALAQPSVLSASFRNASRTHTQR
jgi:tetratricopeptide (TPR) repeat protein